MSSQFLLQSVAETRERFFQWEYLPPPWVIFLLVLPAVLFLVGFFYRRERPLGGNHTRWILGAFRVAVILAVLALLARPMLREIVYQTRDPQILLMVDDSLSMKIEDKYADRSIPRRIADLFRTSPETVERTSRYDLVHRLLKDGEIRFLDRLRERGKVSIWSFSSRPKKLRELDRLGKDSPEAGTTGDSGGPEILPEYTRIQGEDRLKQTWLGDALSEVARGGRGPFSGGGEPDAACVILFTDGQQNGGRLEPEKVARKLGLQGIPVYPIGIGSSEPPQDIRITSLDANEVVLAGDRVSFVANLESDGFRGERVMVELLFDGELVDTQYITLGEDRERQSVTLTHTPKIPGDFTATVRVEPLPSELFEENNIASRPLKVLDQRIKVLYLEGPPRWEYRYLKNALIRDPTMEAQAFLYSADPEFIQDSSPGVPPLEGFPRGRENLFQYHVVIIGDVDPDTDNLTSQEMELLKDFVSEAGGGVVFIAGANANPARYLHTPLNQLLPVEVPAAGRGSGIPSSPADHFNVTLTGVGKEHPVMRLVNDPEENQKLWENPGQIEGSSLPPFYWFARVNREKKGAVKLAMHPTSAHPLYGPWVIFAFQNVGKGKTFFSAVDNTWRWRPGVDNKYFYKFWGQVIRFVASGRLMGKTPRFSIQTDKMTYFIGEKINISCRVYDANMRPATDETVKVYHQMELASQGQFQAPEVITLNLNKVKGPGSYDGSIQADRIGRHHLWLGSEVERMASRSIVVEVPALEFRDIRMNRELLENISSLSGGKYFDFADCASAIDDITGIARPRRTPIDDRLHDIWDMEIPIPEDVQSSFESPRILAIFLEFLRQSGFWIVLLLTALLAVEWIYRKMVKLL